MIAKNITEKNTEGTERRSERIRIGKYRISSGLKNKRNKGYF